MLIESLINVIKSIGVDIKTIAESVDKKVDKEELSNDIKEEVKEQLATTDLSSKRDKNDGLFTTNIAVDANSNYSHVRLYNMTKGYVKLESAPETNSEMGSFVKCNNQDAMLYKLRLPNRNGVLAMEEDMRNVFGLLHKYPTNTSFANLSNQQWNQKGVFSCYFNQNGRFENQPTQYGQLINLTPESNNSVECAQIWIAQNGGDVWTRGGNGANAVKDRGFRRLAWIDEVTSRRAVVDSGFNSGNGDFWRLWSDGWLEQGGHVTARDVVTSIDCNYHLPFRNIPIVVISGSSSKYNIRAIETTKVRVYTGEQSRTSVDLCWQAQGYKA